MFYRGWWFDFLIIYTFLFHYQSIWLVVHGLLEFLKVHGMVIFSVGYLLFGFG